MNENLSNEQLSSHQKIAKDLFNKTWELMEKEDRTEEEEQKMLHMAHASCYHWGECGTALEKARGEWQISRVYSLLELPVQALFHAEKSLEYCQKNGLADFDLAFAYEAITRAYSLIGDMENQKKFYKLAEQRGNEIGKAEDKDYFFSELNPLG